jgi:hypothetical protein
MNNEQNIFNNKDNISETLMLKYLEGKASPEEQWQVEQALSQEGLEADAVEGLQQFNDKAQIQKSVSALQEQLHTITQKNRNRKKQRKFKDNPWNYIIVAFILILITMGYYIIKQLFLKNG